MQGNRVEMMVFLMLLGLLGLSARHATAQVGSEAPRATGSQSSAQRRAQYARMPLRFEQNEGQADRRVKFLAHGRGYTLFLAGDEAVLKLEKASQMANGKGQKSKLTKSPLALTGGLLLDAKEDGSAANDQGQLTKDAVLRLKLVGAKAVATVTGVDELPGKSNYFIGNDPAQWRTNVPNYARVKYEGVYPGVDLVYYGNQQHLEYDFVVAPGADPGAIKLDVGAGLAPPSYFRNRGLARNKSAQLAEPTKRAGPHRKSWGPPAPPLRIAANGNLVVEAGGGEVTFHKPLVYQSEPTANHQSAIENRQFLQGQYVLAADGTVHFDIPNYDKSKALTIDPTLFYSTYL